MKTITLKTPLTRPNGEVITELHLREPTAEDAIKLGYPYRVVMSGNGAAIEQLPGVALEYAATLTGYPKAALKVSLPDLMVLQNELQGFFMGSAAEPATTFES